LILCVKSVDYASIRKPNRCRGKSTNQQNLTTSLQLFSLTANSENYLNHKNQMRVEKSKQPENILSKLRRRIAKGKRKGESCRKAL